MGQYEVYWMGVGACIAMAGVANFFFVLWLRERREQRRLVLLRATHRVYASQQI